MKAFIFAILSACLIVTKSAKGVVGGKSAAAVTGQLKCGSVPATGTYVRLYRVKQGSKEDTDQIIDEGKTDSAGKFLVEGNTNGFPVAELEMKDPAITIYHSCDLTPEEFKKSGYRKFTYSIPPEFVALGAKAKKTLNIGNLNLQLKYPEESRAKNFVPQE